MTEQEYNQCVDSYADPLFRFIVKNIRHPEEAKDIVQNSFEKLWLHRQEVENAKAKSYLFTVGYHNMIDQLRRNKKIMLVENFKEEEYITEQKMHRVKAVLEEGLERLTERQRSLILLKDYEGYSYEEIGRITGLNESQVKVYLHRARIILKNFIVKKENVV